MKKRNTIRRIIGSINRNGTDIFAVVFGSLVFVIAIYTIRINDVSKWSDEFFITLMMGASLMLMLLVAILNQMIIKKGVDEIKTKMGDSK